MMASLIRALTLSLLIGGAGCAGFLKERPTPGEVATRVLEKEAGLVEIWTGFWVPGTPFLVFDPDGDAVLRTTREPPAGFHPWSTEETDLSDPAIEPSIYRHRGVPEGLDRMYRRRYPLGEETLTAVPLERTAVDTLNTLFHESFHEFQAEHFERDSETLLSLWVAPESITAEIIVLARMEQEELSRALESGSDPELIEHATNYLVLRKKRLDGMPANAEVLERRYARSEGMATLVEARGLSLVLLGSIDDSRVAHYLRVNYLTEQFNSFSPSPADSILRWRQYGIGAAIGWILDRLAVADWQRRVESGEPLNAILAEALAFNPEIQGRSVSSLLDSPEFEQRLADAGRWLRSLRLPSAAEVRDARRKIVIQHSKACTLKDGGFVGSPIRVAKDAILVRASHYHSDTDCALLIVEKTAVLQEEGADEMMRLLIPVHRWPRIQWSDDTNVIETDSLTINTRRLKFQLRTRARVTRTPDTILIEFLDPAKPAQ